jgi:tetratricopeptide (TPR) repeat protein
METRSEHAADEAPGRAAGEAPDPEALRRASMEARRAREREATDPEGAAARLEAAVRALGPLPLLSVPLAALLRRLARWDALAALCREAGAACADARETAAWQLQLAEACEALGDVDGAVAAYRAALAARPRELAALQALQRLHRALGDHAALARALESELTLRAGDEEIAPRLELSRLFAGPLQRSPEALLHLRRVLDLDPGDAETRARALALAEELGAAAEEVALLEIAAARARSESERARLLARQAALLAGPLARPEQAISRWREALALDPDLTGALAGLRSVHEQLGSWPDVLACLHEESRSAGPEVRRALLERAARVAADHLGSDAALPWLERLRACVPEDVTVLARMAALHRHAERRLALRACLDAELALGPAPERALALERERATLLPDPPLAAARRLPAQGPAPRVGAHGSPKAIARSAPPPACVPPLPRAPRESDPDAAARAAERELATLDPHAPVFAERRRALARSLAHLYADALSDSARALPHLRALVTAEPGVRGIPALEAERGWAEERLLACLRAEGSHLELAERLSTRLARRPDDAEGWLELARLREEELFCPAEAAHAYRNALAHGAPAADVLPRLRRASEALGDWAEVARTLEVEIAQETTAQGRATLLRSLGEVAWRRLGATTRASRAFAGALEADPRDRISLRALQQLLMSMEDWRGSLDLIESEIELLPREAASERRRLWLRAAEIAGERVGDLERAIRALDAAHALAPLDRTSRAWLGELLHRSGATARYVQVATERCDDADAPPDPAAELRLAAALSGLQRHEEARSRVKRALAASPRLAGAWQLLAEIRLAQGAREEAAESLVRAAENAAPASAVAHLLRAAALVESTDLEYGHALRERACVRDVASVPAHAARARSALALRRHEEAEQSAVRAVELALVPDSGFDPGPLVEIALAVANAARGAGRLSLAARLLDGVHALTPNDPGVLRARAEALFALGDLRGARQAAAALLARHEASRKDAGLLVIEAEGLAYESALDEARERFSEATRLDPSLAAAWAGLADAHERSGQPLEAVRALDAWAEAAEPSARAVCRLRAAELVLAQARDGSAERRLRALLREPSVGTRASELLATHWLEGGRPADALEVATAALAGAGDPARAALSRLCARALEDLGHTDAAALAHAAVLAAEPEAVDAVRARAALLRAKGAWHEAALALASFLARPPSAAAEAVAEVWLELSQLRAGPLEDLEGARVACEEAVRLWPGLGAAREALADLLAADPTRRDEAVARHRELLEATPDRVTSLRALVTVAEASGRSELAADGRLLIEAIAGRLGPPESGGHGWLRLRVVGTPALENPIWERARQLARAVASEISRALDASEVLEPPEITGAVESFRLGAVVAEAALAGPALVPLRDDEAGAVLSTVAALAVQREVVCGHGRLVNALALRFGRGARRRAREALAGAAPEEIAEIDFVAWRSALRALASAVALDATGGDLHAALEALADEEDAERTSPAARELLRRVVSAFGRKVAGEGAAE